jgi:hypothetical protein
VDTKALSPKTSRPTPPINPEMQIQHVDQCPVPKMPTTTMRPPPPKKNILQVQISRSVQVQCTNPFNPTNHFHLCEVSAALLASLQVERCRLELDADGVEGLLEARIA